MFLLSCCHRNAGRFLCFQGTEGPSHAHPSGVGKEEGMAHVRPPQSWTAPPPSDVSPLGPRIKNELLIVFVGV